MKLTDKKKSFSTRRIEQAIDLTVLENRKIKEVSVRCPYCGDSRRNRAATHLGIRFDGIPAFYHCFRCNTKGSVDAKFLKDMEVDQSFIGKYLKYVKKNRYLSLPSSTEVSFTNSRTDFNFRYYDDSKQLKYLEERFNKEFTEEDIKRYRVILNPTTFLLEMSRDLNKEIKAAIDLSNHIGFLTQDGKQAVFRAIDKDIEPRFYNMTIEETDYRKLYVLDNEVDLKADKFNFILTEGIFDIIGVYEHFYKNKDIDLSNYIFVAALGKSFDEPINRLIQSGFLDFEIFLFADTSEDIDLDFYTSLFRNEYIEEIHIGRNIKEGEKDFGVASNRIEFDKFETLNRKILARKIEESRK